MLKLYYKYVFTVISMVKQEISECICKMFHYETVTGSIDGYFRGQQVDWELIMMKNTEECQHLLLHSPPAQEKQGTQSTQIHLGEQSLQTHVHA